MKRKYRVASTDYCEDMLPQSHKEVFLDVLKLHWFDLLKLGGILLAFFMPSILLTLAGDLWESQVTSQMEGMTQEEVQQLQLEIASFRCTCSVIRIPLYVLFSMCLAGAVRFIRQLAHEQIPIFWRDIGRGIRQNGVQTAVLAFVFGIQQAIGCYLSNMAAVIQSVALELAASAYHAIFAVAFLPIWAYMIVFIGLYQNSFKQNLRLAIALYAKTIGRTLITLLVCCAVLAVGFVPVNLCHLIGNVLGMLTLPISMLMWTLFVFEQLDLYIHPHFFPELVGKGLYKRPMPDEINENLKGDAVPESVWRQSNG